MRRDLFIVFVRSAIATVLKSFSLGDRGMALFLQLPRQANSEFKQQRRGRLREQQKGNSFRLTKQHLFTCITLLRNFLSRHCTTTIA